MKKDLQKILHSSVGDLAHGRTSEYVLPGFWTMRGRRPARAPRVLRQLHMFYIINLIARLVRSNAPLAPGLLAASAGAPSWKLGKALNSLSHDIEHGLSLADAMRRQPAVFPLLYADLVQAGETTGSLEQTLNSIMEDMAAERQAAREIKKFLVYFSVMLLAFAMFAAFLNVKVMPVFTEIARDMDVPAGYQPYRPYVLATHIMDHAGIMITGALATGILLFLLSVLPHPGRIFRRARKLHRGLSEIGLRLPFIKRLIKNRNLARSLSMLAQLTEAGFPIDQALDRVVASDVSPRFSYAFGRVCNKVRRGEPLQQALQAEAPLLPKSLAAAAANANFHGDLPGALRNLAEFYHKKSVKQVRMIAPLLMPALILILGALVFTQYFSTFAATINISETIMGGM